MIRLTEQSISAGSRTAAIILVPAGKTEPCWLPNNHSDRRPSRLPNTRPLTTTQADFATTKAGPP